MNIVFYLLFVSAFLIVISRGLATLNKHIATTEAKYMPPEVKQKISLPSCYQSLAPEERQTYQKKNSIPGILYLLFIAMFTLVISIILGDGMISLVYIIPITVIILFLTIRDKLRMSKNKSLYKIKAYVLSCSYGRYGFCTFIYYDFLNNSFVAEKKPTPLFAQKNHSLCRGDFINIIVKQTTYTIQFVDFLLK